MDWWRFRQPDAPTSPGDIVVAIVERSDPKDLGLPAAASHPGSRPEARTAESSRRNAGYRRNH